MNFCHAFMNKKNIVAHHQGCHNHDYGDDVFLEDRLICAGKLISLDNEILASAHCYVSFNKAMVEPFAEYVF